MPPSLLFMVRVRVMQKFSYDCDYIQVLAASQFSRWVKELNTSIDNRLEEAIQINILQDQYIL